MGLEVSIQGLSHAWRGRSDSHAGLPVLIIDNPLCHAVVACHGAQVLEYVAQGQSPLLWLSEQSHYADTKAIRGGIPLCFPWFGAHPTDSKLPAHGFARTRDWILTAASVDDEGHLLTFSLSDDDATRALWPHAFHAELTLRLGATLQLTLRVTNTDIQPLSYTFAMHSYFAVTDIRQTEVCGLEDVPFLDQLSPALGDQQRETAPIRFGAETDRIYQGGAGQYQIGSRDDTVIDMNSSNCPSAIVWNPWVEKAARLGDMHPAAWPEMLCVESGAVGQAAVSLDAGATRIHQLTVGRRSA